MPSVAVQTNWSWLEDIAKIADYYQQVRVEDVTLHLSISPESVNQLDVKVRDENQKDDDSSSESTITNDCVKESNDDGVSHDPLITTEITNKQQQLVDTEQPDHLLQQSYQKLLHHDKSSPIAAGDNPRDNHNDLVTTGSPNNMETTLVQPSTVDATMPLILKYSRESDERPPDSQACGLNYENLSSEESSLMTCEFCGAEINPDLTPVHSNDLSDSEEDDTGGYCCHDYKLFIELTTNYMEQMVQALQSEQAKRIDVKPGKKLMKKAAEEQAQARLKSKRLHHRLMRSDSDKIIDPIKILQSASFYTLSKQTKTINFSLSSPKYSNQGWVVRVSSGKHHHVTQQVNPRRRKRKDRTSVQTTDSFILPTISFRSDLSDNKLSDKSTPIVKTYSNGKVFQILLPDGTGHCRYPSGNLAIVSTVLHPGLLSHILYEDDPTGVLLGYFDEAGRAYTYYRDHKLKLFFTYSIAKLFEPGGKVWRKWKWREFCSKSPSNTNIQVNQQFHLKISNQENIVLTFSSLSHHTKFSIGCKVTEPIVPTLVQSDVSSMQQYHKKTKAEISFLLQNMNGQCHLTTHSNKSTMVLPPVIRTKGKSTLKHVMF